MLESIEDCRSRVFGVPDEERFASRIVVEHPRVLGAEKVRNFVASLFALFPKRAAVRFEDRIEQEATNKDFQR